MPINKHLLPDRSRLLQAKLETLSEKITKSLGAEGFQTKEQYLFEVIKVIGEFYESINQPQLTRNLIDAIRVDDIPDAQLWNLIWDKVVGDLTSIFLELENIGDLTVANFNFITTENNRITSRLKSVSSKLGDFILYSVNPTRDALFFKDSFNDLSKIQVNSGLLNKTENNINQTEGIVTLPIDRTKDSLIVIKESPVINPNSNGVTGNNQELGSAFNGDISTLLDNNADTWFEYERVVTGTADDKQPLILDLTMNLGEERIVNHIRVNPNNFGTKTVININEIETSIDGEVYTSIKDDIPIAGFVVGDEENIFALAPSTSKFAGQGLYTFTPRRVKYVRFIFQQNEPYVIDTPNGERLRYAIGIRDINIRGFNYLNEGELVSTLFETVDEIRKVSIEANQNPQTFSELASVKYFISPDNGSSWHEVQPRNFPGISGLTTTREILDFNGPEQDSVVTPVPVRSIRLKIQLGRVDENFEEGSTAFRKEVQTKAELHQVPQDSPFTIDLEEPPVEGTVVVVDTLYGSRGLPASQYILGHASDKLSTSKYRLPFKNLPRPVKKVSDGATIPTYHVEEVPASEWIHWEIGGEEWTQATKSLSEYSLNLSDPNSFKIYNFNPNTGIVEFGDGLTNTLLPGPDQPIGFYMDPERMYPSATENDHTYKLDFFTSSSKGELLIKRFDKIKEVTEFLPRKATVIHLSQSDLVDTTGISSSLSDLGYDSSPQTFINGKEEILSTTQWSLDTEEGIIYLGAPTSNIQDVSVTYTYQPIIELTDNDWDWATANLLRDSVSIRESGWKTIQVENETLPTTQNSKVLDLSQLAVVEGTLDLTTTVSGVQLDSSSSLNPFVKEVPYRDGHTELHLPSVIKTSQNFKDMSSGGSWSGGIFAEGQLSENISTLTGHKPSIVEPRKKSLLVFSEKSFASSPGNFTQAGDFAIDKDPNSATYGTVRIALSSSVQLSNLFQVTYYYDDPNFKDNGLYSVDYRRGRVFCQRAIDPTGSGAWSLSADFEYTDFRVSYRIARLLNPESYDVDITNNTVTFKDTEMLKFMNIPHDGGQGRYPLLPFYLVNYEYIAKTREDIEGLRDFFSPVVKDYAIKILTKGNIF